MRKIYFVVFVIIIYNLPCLARKVDLYLGQSEMIGWMVGFGKRCRGRTDVRISRFHIEMFKVRGERKSCVVTA